MTLPERSMRAATPPLLADFVPPPFAPHPLLSHRHAQTAWGTLFPRQQAPHTEWARAGRPWEHALTDGDVMTGWLHTHPTDPERRERPTLLLLHGLEGTADAHYVRGMSRKAFALGWHSLRLNYRGCGEGAGRARRVYHGMAYPDVDHVVRRLAEQADGPLALAGVSLGANKLLRLLVSYGEAPPAPLAAAAAISPPLDFEVGSRVLGRGFNLVYDTWFLRSLRQKVADVAAANPEDDAVRAAARAAKGARTLRAFDAAFTAPVGGFRDLADYYGRAGAGPDLGQVRVPTLLLTAEDDPIIPFHQFGTFAPIIEGNPWLTPLYVPQGGHVGFMAAGRAGDEPWMDAFWGENVALLYLRAVLEPSGPR